jgi:hypothetical protein
MCGHSGYHERHGYGGCCCGPKTWGPGFRFGRRFATREERIAWLEDYLKDLQAEAKAVEERIAELKSTRGNDR